jgi:trehalose 6-phosphate synthase
VISGNLSEIPHLSPKLRNSPRLIIVSNRGPFEHQRDEQGALVRRPTGGGVAIALTSMASQHDLTWVVGAVSQADRDLVSLGLGEIALNNGHRLRFVGASPSSYDLFYSVFCNPVLWFLQHSLWHLLEGRPNLEPDILDAWNNGYLPLNAAFAEAVIDEVRRTKGRAQVMLHDYHLYAAPLFIRDRCPDVELQHFTHIPWPGPETWRVMPGPIVESICEGMLANDSVSFQTEQSKHNFALTCQAYLPGVSIDRDESLVRYRGRTVSMFANPISVDVFELRRKLASPEVKAYRERLAAGANLATIVRVDRMDPAKNVLTGFKAYRLLLEQHPEWRGRVRFLAFLVPSRESIQEYREYKEKVFAVVDEINALYGTKSWRPITLFYEENRPQALAGLSLYDVLLTNSVADGMNLVAKEGPVLNQTDGAVVLSTGVGSYQQQKEAAIGVKPLDIEGTAEALEQALRMSLEERREKARTLRHIIGRHDIASWARTQFASFKPPKVKVERAPKPLERRPVWLKGALFGRVAQMASAAALVSVIGFGSFAVSTSASALPGDWQYPIKRTMEDVRYTFTFTDSGKQRLDIAYAEERVSEIQQLADRGRPIGEGPLRDAANRMDSLVNRFGNNQFGLEDAQRVQELAQQQKEVLTQVAPMVVPAASDELTQAKSASSDVLALATDYVTSPPLPTETPAASKTVHATTSPHAPTATPPAPLTTPTAVPISIVALPTDSATGTAWSLLRTDNLSMEVPSESSGWQITTGPDSALGTSSAVILSKVDGSATVVVDLRDGDAYWKQLFPDGAYRQYKIRTSNGGLVSVASEADLDAFHVENAATVAHIARSITIEATATVTPSSTATATPQGTATPARTATRSPTSLP